MKENKKKIVVAMSGGVDSSTVAALLHAQGHEVIGITLQLYDHGIALEKKGACCAGQDIYDAQMAAEKIRIPHYVLNYESIFKQSVIEDFADSYLRGETPIPCVRCNQKVKFKDLFKVAKDLGADSLATGHYVRKIVADSKAHMYKGVDHSKDQSYFLFATTQEQLDFLEFPLGNLKKEETRALAKEFGLEIADKPDSQDICFVPNGNYAKVIEKLRPEAFSIGEVIDKFGNVLGYHNGIVNYTIGQRRGLGISNGQPLYVIKIKPESNQVVVGFKEDLNAAWFKVSEINWLGDEEVISDAKVECMVKLRSTHKGINATVHFLDKQNAKVELSEPHAAVTPGQACVMYQGERMIGGGWIGNL